MDSSYISHFRDPLPLSFSIHTLLHIELLSILPQKYNPVATKTDRGGEKNEEGRLNISLLRKGYSIRDVTMLSKWQECENGATS